MIVPTLEFNFRVAKKDVEYWVPIVDVISNSFFGYKLERLVECFGHRAESLLGNVLDIWGSGINEVSGRDSRIEGCLVYIRLEGGWPLAESKHTLNELFIECGAMGMQVSFEDEGSISHD